jgi:hypothetical protein
MKTSSKVLWSMIVSIFIVLALVDITQANSYNLQRFEISHHNKNIVGDGNMISKTVPLKNIQSLDVIGNYKIVINVGKQSALTVTADDNILPNIDINITDNELSVDTKSNVTIFPTLATLSITTPNLKHINLLGNSSLQALNINTKHFSINSIGNNNIVLSDKTNNLEIKTIGNSNLQANKLVAHHVNINSMGDSDIAVNAVKALTISMVGKGNIKYSGNPNITKNVLGEGTIDNS